jgi:2-amino-4-hydroxy-6-hydroxymethyldihydropteridine diphosphokinase/dihydropteroate synthase
MYDTKHAIALSLGSNIGNKEENISSAIKSLNAQIQNIKVSNYFYNPAILPENAPQEWNQPFVNVALIGKTMLTPQQLLEFCKKIEFTLGRPTNYYRWSPRIIDIDILLYDDKTVKEDNLIIPHPLMGEREFVMTPLSEILPRLKFND